MKKISFVLVFVIALSVFFSACGSEKGKSKHEKPLSITYSNLLGEKDIDELSELLTKSGVNKNNIEKIAASVKNYNDTVGSDLLTAEGKIDLSLPIPQYDGVKIDERWLNKNELFIGYNCRLTAFEIMKDFITVDDMTQSNPMSLFMDEEALDNSTDNYFTDDELARFEAMYSTINTTASTDVNEQYKAQKAYWDSIGVKFGNDDKISLISVYIHNHFSEDENELIVGHTGVLLSTEDGYVFFEKLSFQLPYQMIRFNSKDELKQYLMAAYDTDTTGESAKPFILENDSLL